MTGSGAAGCSRELPPGPLSHATTIDLNDNFPFFQDNKVAKLAQDSHEIKTSLGFCKCLYVGDADCASVLWDCKIVSKVPRGYRGTYEITT